MHANYRIGWGLRGGMEMAISTQPTLSPCAVSKNLSITKKKQQQQLDMVNY